MTQDTVSWSSFYAYRKEIRKAHPSVYKLPVQRKLLAIVLAEIHDGDKVLDVGASNRSLGDRVMAALPGVRYKTMDIDREQPHDYYDLDEIGETFDAIVLSEVIEHLEFRQGMVLLQRLFGLLDHGGKIILSTPNLHHPNRYWWDLDHKTPYRYDAIGAALLAVGFRVDGIYRTYNAPIIKRFVRLYLASHLHRYLDVDFAKSIVVVASKQ